MPVQRLVRAATGISIRDIQTGGILGVTTRCCASLKFPFELRNQCQNSGAIALDLSMLNKIFYSQIITAKSTDTGEKLRL